GHLSDRAMETQRLDIHLGAVARGEYQRLGHVIQPGHGGGQGTGSWLIQGDPLEQLERRTAVRQTDDEQTHPIASESVPCWSGSSVESARRRRCSWKARICSSVARSTPRTSTPSGTLR